MESKYLASGWIKDEERLFKGVYSTAKEFFNDYQITLEENEGELESLEGVECPAYPVIVEELVSERLGSNQSSEFIHRFGNALAHRDLSHSHGNLSVIVDIVDTMLIEMSNHLYSLKAYRKWENEYKGLVLYFGWAECGSISLLMAVDGWEY